MKSCISVIVVVKMNETIENIKKDLLLIIVIIFELSLKFNTVHFLVKKY